MFIRANWSKISWLIVVFLLASCNADNPFTAEATVAESFTVDGSATVTVDTFNGRIDVTVGADDVLRAEVIKFGVGITPAKAEADLENINVTFNQDGEQISISAARPESEAVSNSGASVRLSVPSDTALNLKTSNGIIEIHQVTGPIQVASSNGAVIIRGGQGQITAETNNDNIEVHASEAILFAKTSNGKITFVGDMVDGPQTVETSNGNIEITLPATAAFTVNANTANGVVRSDFTLETPGEVGNTRLQGTIGSQPSANLVLKTSNGDIILSKDR